MPPSQMNDDEGAVDEIEAMKSRVEEADEIAQADDDPNKVDELEASKKRRP